MFRLVLIILVLLSAINIESIYAQRRGGCPGGMCKPQHYGVHTNRMNRKSMGFSFSHASIRTSSRRTTSWSRGSYYSRTRYTKVNNRATAWRRQTRSPSYLSLQIDRGSWGKDRAVKRNKTSSRALGKLTDGRASNKAGSVSANNQKPSYALKPPKKPKRRTHIYRQPRLRRPKQETGLFGPGIDNWQTSGKTPRSKKDKPKQKVKVKTLDPPTKK